MSSIQVFNPETSPIEGTMLLEASAGTGKTYALERMVARLVGRDKNPLKIDEILVVTFTNRAAREMKERIRALLALRSEETGRGPEERERYRAAVSGFDRSAIYTIHGFCQMVLSSWPFESASPFKQELVPGGVLESAELRSWIAGLKRDDLDRDVMRIAYKQAGNIENLIAGISKSMANDNIPRDAVVLPTKEESAAFDAYCESSKSPGSPLSQAVGALFFRTWSDDAVNEVIKSATGAKRGKTAGSLEKIRNHMTACGNLYSSGNAGIISLSQIIFGKKEKKEFGSHFLELMVAGIILAPGSGITGETSSLISVISDLYQEMDPYVEFTGESLISLTEPYMQCAFRDIAETSVNKSLKNLKNRSGQWGYADLICRVADKVAETDSPLLAILRKRFAAGLIDEFQDTDPRQWTLFSTIFGSSGTGHVLALIGDPKQSIYGFRGTGLQAYNTARSSVSQKRMFHLDTNYRSTALLVDAANRFFAPLFSSQAPGFAAVHSGKTNSDKLLWSEGEIPVTLIRSDSKEHAAESIAGEIRRMLDPEKGAKWLRADGREEEVSASDIAVLVRGYTEEGPLIGSLKQLGIPVVSIKSRSIFTQALAGELRILLDAFENPRDMRLWRSVLLGGFFELPADLLLKFQEEGRLDEFVEKGGEWQKLFLEGRSIEAFDDFFEFSSRLGDWSVDAGRNTPGEYLKYPWNQRVLSEPDGLRQWQDWRHLCELIQSRQAEGVKEISRIKTWMIEQAEAAGIEGSEESLRLETENPAVKVLTMHSAKGLEFPLVFLLGGFNGGTKRKKDGEYRFDRGGKLVVDRVCRESNRQAHLAYQWEENKRLWYVAFTRASVKLWMPLPRGKNVCQAESLLDEMLRSEDDSSLKVSKLPPHEVLKPKDADDFRAGLNQRIQDLTVETPHLFSAAELSTSNLQPLEVQSYPKPEAADLPDRPTASRDPVTSSYTSLVKSAPSEEEDDRDVDAGMSVIPGEETVSEAAAEKSEPLPMAADRGALFGTLVHALLEECDFSKTRILDAAGWLADEETDELFSSLSRRYYPPDWYKSRSGDLKTMVWNTLRSPIPELGRLCDIEKKQMRPEIEFNMAVPRKGELFSGNLQTKISSGFLKGFIDLCLKSDGRWWVADWKTNVPPGVESAESYNESTMKEMMDHSHYHLQYELYLLALCRTLSGNRGEAVNWEEEIGGAVYLFVRGTRENDSRGIFVSKPTLERMLTLASAMGLEGVLK